MPRGHHPGDVPESPADLIRRLTAEISGGPPYVADPADLAASESRRRAWATLSLAVYQGQPGPEGQQQPDGAANISSGIKKWSATLVKRSLADSS